MKSIGKTFLRIKKDFNTLLANGKILAENLSAIEYNSKNEMNQEGEYSLRQFIERESTYNFFGSLGSIISGGLLLWATNDENGNNLYYYDKKLVVGEELEKAVKDINRLLKRIVTAYKWDSLIEILKDKNELFKRIISKAFVFEIVFLNSMLNEGDLTEEEQKNQNCRYDYKNKLIHIYKYEELEKTSCFKAISKSNCPECREIDPFLKSRKLFEICKNILELRDEDINQDRIFALGRAAWECSHNSQFAQLIEENKNIIFYGAPGTGKTYAVKRAIESLGGSENTVFVQFHPSFSYEDFIEGIKPLGVDANGNLKVGPVNGVFKDLCIKAKKEENKNKKFYFIADEINRANLSAVFGETLSLIEPDYRYSVDKSDEINLKNGKLIKTPLSALLKELSNDKNFNNDLAFAKDSNGNILFGIPDNITFIGMMNDSDKSIDSFDLALRRRFIWVLMSFDEKALVSILLDKGLNDDAVAKYIQGCKRLNYFITGVNPVNLEKTIKPLDLGRQFEIGHAIYKNIANPEYCYGGRFRKDALSQFFDRYLLSTLTEYLRTYSSESKIEENVDLARKIFITDDGE